MSRVQLGCISFWWVHNVCLESEFRLMKCPGDSDGISDRIARATSAAPAHPHPHLLAEVSTTLCPLGSSSNSHVTKPSKFNSFEIWYALHIFNDFFRLPSLHNTRFDELPTIPIQSDSMRCDTNRIPCCTHLLKPGTCTWRKWAPKMFNNILNDVKELYSKYTWYNGACYWSSFRIFPSVRLGLAWVKNAADIPHFHVQSLSRDGIPNPIRARDGTWIRGWWVEVVDSLAVALVAAIWDRCCVRLLGGWRLLATPLASGMHLYAAWRMRLSERLLLHFSVTGEWVSGIGGDRRRRPKECTKPLAKQRSPKEPRVSAASWKTQ